MFIVYPKKLTTKEKLQVILTSKVTVQIASGIYQFKAKSDHIPHGCGLCS